MDKGIIIGIIVVLVLAGVYYYYTTSSSTVTGSSVKAGTSRSAATGSISTGAGTSMSAATGSISTGASSSAGSNTGWTGTGTINYTAGLNNNGGGPWNDGDYATCPAGSYIQSMDATSADMWGTNRMMSMQGTCSDGTKLPVFGVYNAANPHTVVTGPGFQGMNIYNNDGLEGGQFVNVGGATNGAWFGGRSGATTNQLCPSGQRVVGYGGRDGAWVNDVQFACR